MNDEALGRDLLSLARAAIAARFGHSQPATADAPALREAGAAFVTLTQEGRLRGCIGSLEAWRPLAEDVRENAVAAAFRDPRFPPLDEDEFAGTRVEVSLLSPATPMPASSETEALALLQPGIDGVILEWGKRRATFLPQVWEQLPEPRQFLAHLKRKAGLPEDFWDGDIRLSRYRVEKWKES